MNRIFYRSVIARNHFLGHRATVLTAQPLTYDSPWQNPLNQQKKCMATKRQKRVAAAKKIDDESDLIKTEKQDAGNIQNIGSSAPTTPSSSLFSSASMDSKVGEDIKEAASFLRTDFVRNSNYYDGGFAMNSNDGVTNFPFQIASSNPSMDIAESSQSVMHDQLRNDLSNVMVDPETGVVSSDITSKFFDHKDLFDPSVHLASAPKDWSGYEPTTPLTEDLMSYIGVKGTPITVAEFMNQALVHPLHGYYTSKDNDGTKHAISKVDREGNIIDDFDKDEWDIDGDNDVSSSSSGSNVSNNIRNESAEEKESDCNDNGNHSNEGDISSSLIGPKGDFITAPEISQVFGEMIMVWYITQWKEHLKKSKSVQLVELGPGNGTLIRDMLKFAFNKQISHFGDSINTIHLVEQSQSMRKLQRQTLEEFSSSSQNSDNSNIKDKPCRRIKFSFEDYDCGKTESNNLSSIDNSDVSLCSTSTDENDDSKTIRVYWHDSFESVVSMQKEVEELKSMPLFITCQEFFDALPIHAFEKTKKGNWRERLVDVAMIEDNETEEEERKTNTIGKVPTTPTTANDGKDILKPRLRIVLAPETTPALKTLLNADDEGYIFSQNSDGSDASRTSSAIQKGTSNLPGNIEDAGQIIEVCPQGILLVRDIATIIEKQGGACLIIDYGQIGTSDTIRGFSNHKQVPFLSLPGEIDVTADVDFGAIKHSVNYSYKHHKQLSMKIKAAKDSLTQEQSDSSSKATNNEDDKRKIEAFGPISQGQFLMSMGISERIMHAIESDNTNEEEAKNLYGAFERLVLPEEMGERFKVLAIGCRKDGIFEPPGFSKTN